MNTAAVSCVRHLMEEYRRFLLTTYRFADPQLRQQFEEHIRNTDILIKGPYATLAREYASGRRLSELVAQGIGHKELSKLKWSFGDHPLYRHQEKSLICVDANNHSCVVKTGTGSGKTEAFLLPSISGVLKMRDQGIKGTKAILMYPMNALANDQLIRLRELIRDRGVNLTFAMYTGDSETVANTLGEPVSDLELVKRDHIRKNPPDILLTNYKQLEFLLIRKDDRPIFSPALRYLVLDEIHSYRGALATEIACLIRRLKSRCSLKAGQLRCLGTSATVSEGAGGDEGLRSFVQDLFGEPFNIEDIIGEEYAPLQPPTASYKPPFPDINPAELVDFPVTDTKRVFSLATVLCGKPVPTNGSTAQKIANLYQGNEVIEFLKAACAQPHSISELAKELEDRFPEAKSISEMARQALLESYLMIGSVGTEEDPPCLRPKLHTFFHGIYDVGLCMNPACRTLVRDGSDQCPKCQAVVRPAVLCRTCGQDFVKVRFIEDSDKPPLPNEDFRSDENTGFITPHLHSEADSEEEDESDSHATKQTATRSKMRDCWVCHACGMVHDEETGQCQNCGEQGSISKQMLLEGAGSTCPACNGTYPRGDILALLRSGTASMTSLLATHHLDKLSDSDRKLLVFADNRQEAAHQAGYMSDRHRQFALRHAIESVVQQFGQEGSSLTDLSSRLLAKFQELGLAYRRLNTDDKKKWLRTLEYEAASEFCRSTHQRVSLENLAMVEVQYEFLHELETKPSFDEACREAGISIKDGLIAVRAMLDRMRRSRAVSFDFFQKYIDPNREPWSLLQTDPFNLTVPERERGPVFFMLERTEAARGNPSGFKFKPLTKGVLKGAGGAIFKLLGKVGVPANQRDAWIEKTVTLLCELEVLVSPEILPPTVRRAIGGGVPLQISRKVIRLLPASSGHRCDKCQLWHPYLTPACTAPKCNGTQDNLKTSVVDPDSYYVRLYRSRADKRMQVAEHTAQIAQEQRAKREKAFKEGHLDVLVCSPTLELGVDIGPLVTLLLRNCPPMPANYAQRAGRAGRRLRIGFVSTFCGMGPHERHCFEDPSWLVRGEFRPPTVRLDNGHILARHVRSFVLENIEKEFPRIMGNFLKDLDTPNELDLSSISPLIEEIKAKSEPILKAAIRTFGIPGQQNADSFKSILTELPNEFNRVIQEWFEQIQRVFKEWQDFRTITANRQMQQKAKARERAYRELTKDEHAAYVLNYLAAEGVLPSYQFPTDTFSLEPGVNDTPLLRRPAWIALFEFAPGNMVYANGHKLKSIRAFFEGSDRSLSNNANSLEGSGRVRPFCFCEKCGFASEDNLNACPDCRNPMETTADVAFIESFEAEDYTQISSSEESRERVNFERKEHLIAEKGISVELFPYPFTQLEYCSKARVLITNWGKRTGSDGHGEQFDLCPSCGKHRPGFVNTKHATKWNEEHAKFCNGTLNSYVMGYEFQADVLILPVSASLYPQEFQDAFNRTLGSSLAAGAVEVLEVEPDEIAFFPRIVANQGSELIFYETVPGGAGYLKQLASQVGRWAQAAMDRLYNHDCAKACYRCLKSYRNQYFHALLDKNLVRNVLFQLSCGEMISPSKVGKRNEGLKQAAEWIVSPPPIPKVDTPIERKLLEAIRSAKRLPEPSPQWEFKDGNVLLTTADFAYEKEKIAIYCDGFAFHGNKEKLASDAQKRNRLQEEGWAVLTFWGQTILKHSSRCEEQIWRIWNARKIATG